MRAFRLVWWVSFGLLWLASCPGALAQRCVPRHEYFDRQILTADGKLILLETRVGSDYIRFSYGGGRRLPLRVVRLGPAGELEQDSTFRLLWPEWKHHYANQPDLALGRKLPILTPDTVGGLNWTYLSATNRGDLVQVRHDHLRDISKLDSMEIVWDLAIAATFRIDFSRWLPRLAKQPPVFPKGFIRNVYPRLYLDTQFPYLASALAPSFRVTSAQRIELTGEQAYLQKVDDITSPPRQPFISPRPCWELKSPGWNIGLDGFIDAEAPMVTVGPNHRLYVTVSHAEVVSCEPYADVWPIVYCIDLRQGKILWTRTAFHRSYVYD